MATKLVVPSEPDELMALLGDHRQVQAYFSREAVTDGTTKKFLDMYAKHFSSRHNDFNTEIRDQVSAELFDMLRANGGGRTPVGADKLIDFSNGSPRFAPSMAAVGKGRGAVYNKLAPGAVFEQKYRNEDRFSSIGEYCQAIREEARPSTLANRQELLQKLQNVREFQNSFGSEEAGSGGFLIPEIMRSELLQLALESSIVRSRATVIPMSTLSVPIPTVDDTSHVSSLFGGVVFYWAEESASLTETQATFGQIRLTAKKLAGFFKVPNELLADAPAFSGWFDQRIPMGLAWFEDLAFMTESGVGTPEGFINSPGVATTNKESGQASSTILWENITKMYARMLPTSIPNAVWICAIDTFPELATMALAVGTGGGPVWIGNFAGGQGGKDMPPVTILGRPVIFTEKVPALGTTGDINFVDLSYYLIGDRQQVEVAASEHYAFQNNQTAYRIISRVDGRPWLQTPLTPHNGSSNTLSAFVQLQTR